MTTIVGIEGVYGAALAGDRQATDTGSGRRYRMTQPKVITLNCGNIAVGVAGDLRAIQYLAQLNNLMPEVKKKDWDRLSREGVMVEMVLPAWQDYVKAVGKKITATALFAVRGRLFEVGSELDVVRCSGGVHSIGSGSAYALGAASILTKDKHDYASQDLLKIAHNSVKAASDYDVYTGRDIDVLWTSITAQVDTKRDNGVK